MLRTRLTICSYNACFTGNYSLDKLKPITLPLNNGHVMIDKDGLRKNVGIILTNDKGQLFWGRRSDKQNAWQFPQGGMYENETIEEAMYRELYEELGLKPEDVSILGITRRWLRYYLPRHLRRYHSKPLCIGQKQKWFLLKLLSSENNIKLDTSPDQEFDHWKWVSYWQPLQEVIIFKRQVYKLALKEFEKLIC